MNTIPVSTLEALPHALEFIRSASLPRVPLKTDGGLESADEAFLDPAKDQAVAVGSGVMSFMKGLDPLRRRAIADSVLLAQLVANQSVPDRDDVDGWYGAYFDVLGNLGWIIENKEFSVHEASGRGVEAHEAILAVAAGLLGTAPAALAVVKATLGALEKIGSNNSWITLFSRDQQESKAARFQISLAQQDDADLCSLAMMAFALKATAKFIQVIFFKVRLTDASLRKLSTTITIDPQMLAAVHSDIQVRVAAFQKEYLRTLPELKVPASPNP
jgi:hypothetical protein